MSRTFFNKIWIFTFLGIVLFAQLTQAQDLVRVRLQKIGLNQSEVLFSPQMFIKAVDRDFEWQAQRIELGCRARCGFRVDRQKWIWQTTRLHLQGDVLQSVGGPVPSELVIEISANQIQVIGVLTEDQYLMGVVAAEMPVAWPIEALKAQAVVARSYLRATQRERKNQSFDVEASIVDQAYQNVGHLSEANKRKLETAVQSTKGEFLNSKGLPYKAFFHADCGGRTTIPRQVWGNGGGGPVKVVTDSYCVNRRSSHWKVSVSAYELAQSLGISQVKQIQILQRGIYDGRVLSVRVQSKDRHFDLSGQEFRQKIGFTKIPSTQFSIVRVGNRWELQGQGRGHGVGLCQFGARAMAQEGSGYVDILEHYYPREVLALNSSLIAKNLQILERQKRPTLLE